MRMTLSLNICEIRKAKGLTLEDVAAKIGMSVPHLSGVERGKKNLNNHLLTQLADALGVSADQLISSAVKTDVQRLERVARMLPGADLERLTSFADALLASQQGKPQT